MWDLPGSGIEPISPAVAVGFFTTELPGKPKILLCKKLKVDLKFISTCLNSPGPITTGPSRFPASPRQLLSCHMACGMPYLGRGSLRREGRGNKDTPKLIWSPSAKTRLLLMSSEGVGGGGHLPSFLPGGSHRSSGFSELSSYTLLAPGLRLWLLWAQGTFAFGVPCTVKKYLKITLFDSVGIKKKQNSGWIHYYMFILVFIIFIWL